MCTLKRILILFLLTLTACSGNTPDLPSVLASATLPSPTATQTLLPPTATPIPMAMTVNADSISVDEFDAELTRYKVAMESMGKTVSDDEAIIMVGEDLISQLLLAQGAVEVGFSMDENAYKQRLETLISKLGGVDKLSAWRQTHNYTEESFNKALKRAAASAWMRDKIMASVSLTSEQVHVRQLLLDNEDDANNYYEKLRAGASFDDLAIQVEQVDSNTRGDIGWFPRGYLLEKAVEDAAFSLEVGAYSPVMSSGIGFHILKLIERQPDRVLSPDALMVLQTNALNDWLATRRQKSSISSSIVPVP